MSHYKSNLRDLEFNLFEVFGRDDVLGTGPFAEMDPDTARNVLRRGAPARRGPAVGVVRRRRPQPAAVRPCHVDRHAPRVVQELVHRADGRGVVPARPPRPTSAASVPLRRCGGRQPRCCSARTRRRSCTWQAPALPRSSTGSAPPEQKKLAHTMIERKWGATMVLTEPDAGSDVGAGRTKAFQQPDGTWHIEGVKRFITSAECDWPRTSSTSSWPGRRVTARAPRA